jgi:hypothetical protein
LRARAAIKREMFGERAAPAEASVKSAIPKVKTLRRTNRSPYAARLHWVFW